MDWAHTAGLPNTENNNEREENTIHRVQNRQAALPICSFCNKMKKKKADFAGYLQNANTPNKQTN